MAIRQSQNKVKNNLLVAIVLFFIMCNLVSCAPEGNTYKEYGFFSGILHGIVFFFALIGKLFGADIGLYAQNNSGFFYWVGFIIGLGILGGGGTASRR
ncbi:hypothetical protein FAM09_12145 [Niastella caeni]|uniref:Uncharacterized protein n=1 Tax=Niastella caeni TaxID=2569763 RepID=A0A4S8HUE4_9BACT|nr:hypothetical protein [Niastella caeni]THU39258.1 hypothetical protein FAM09_12145 [Niastella caeni]